MKLLFDQNLSFKLVTSLGDLFPGSTQARLVGLDRADDSEIWNFARTDGYAIVSRDADFAEMAALLGAPPKVIWLRGGNPPTTFIAESLRMQVDLVRSFGDDPTSSCLELY